MPSVFLVSDTHFGHAGVCRFVRDDGVTKLRPWDSADEMDEFMVRAWNERVRPTDKVYHFRELRAYHVMNGVILSHIPIHSESLGRFGVNIHGHLHANRVMLPGFNGKITDIVDTRYHNVSVEQLPDFAPILFEDVIKRIEAEGGTIGFQNGNGTTQVVM